jgi:hypothetical protein
MLPTPQAAICAGLKVTHRLFDQFQIPASKDPKDSSDVKLGSRTD